MCIANGVFGSVSLLFCCQDLYFVELCPDEIEILNDLAGNHTWSVSFIF